MKSAEEYRLLMADVYELAGRSRRTSEVIARQAGQTVARWHVLSVLSAGPLTAAAAARRLGLARQSVQRVADALLDDSLLTASPNPDHATSPLLEVTARGRAVLTELVQLADADRSRRLRALDVTSADLAAARETVRTILRALEDR